MDARRGFCCRNTYIFFLDCSKYNKMDVGVDCCLIYMRVFEWATKHSRGIKRLNASIRTYSSTPHFLPLLDLPMDEYPFLFYFYVFFLCLYSGHREMRVLKTGYLKTLSVILG